MLSASLLLLVPVWRFPVPLAAPVCTTTGIVLKVCDTCMLLYVNVRMYVGM